MSEIPHYLSLTDGSDWRIEGDEFNARWVDEFAAILEMEKCSSKHLLNGISSLIFYSKGAANYGGHGGGKILRSRLGDQDARVKWFCSDHESIRIWYHNSVSEFICELNNNEGRDIQIINMWNALQPIYQQSICRGGLPLHAGLAELDGRGFLLVASSDKGKSTCCRRLPDYWKPLCDDEALVVLDKHKKYRAHPFPTWSDRLWSHSEKTWNVQYSVPLSGVFLLEQTEIDEVVPVGEGQAAVLLSEFATQICQKFWRTLDIEDQRRFREALFNNACEMAKQIPAYRLHVSLHGRFWDKMEQVLES